MKPLFLALCCCISIGIAAQVELNFVEIASGFTTPTALRAPADSSNRLFVTQKAGKIRILDLNTNTIQSDDFLDLTFKVSSFFERGLLGLAFHPNFAENGQFFVHYSIDEGFGQEEGSNVISRFTLANPTDTVADINTEEILLVVEQDQANHNGGELKFGPDGLLYFSLGDGGGGGDPNDRGQDPFNMLGSLGRIAVDSVSGDLPYGIPNTNPYADGVNGLPEIFSIGWRNPWRFSFDRLTGDLWVGDVGQNAREEIDFIPAGTGAGLNYGWDCREGDINYQFSSDACDPDGNYEEPVLAIMHNGPNSAGSITGGYVYRGSEWPELYGTYICTDYVTDNFFSIKPDGTGGWDVFPQSQNQISGVATFGEDESGELYAAALFDGVIYQVTGGVNNVQSFDKGLDFSLTLFPNPTQRQLNLQFKDLNASQVVKLKIVNPQGQSVFQQSLFLGAGTANHELHLPELPSGLYQVMVTNQARGEAFPLVIKR